MLSDEHKSAGARTLTEFLAPAAASIKRRSMEVSLERRSMDMGGRIPAGPRSPGRS